MTANPVDDDLNSLEDLTLLIREAARNRQPSQPAPADDDLCPRPVPWPPDRTAWSRSPGLAASQQRPPTSRPVPVATAPAGADSGRGSPSTVSGTWTAWRTAAAQVSAVSIYGWTASVRHVRLRWPCGVGHRLCSPSLRRPWPAGAAVPDRVWPRAARIAMSAVATGEDTPCPQRWPASGRRPDIRPSLRPPQTPAWPASPARPRVPDTSRPESGRSGSSGRSIRGWFRLVTTSSTLPQSRPCGRPPAAAVLGRRTDRRQARRLPLCTVLTKETRHSSRTQRNLFRTW
jgi:hypothetical protein